MQFATSSRAPGTSSSRRGEAALARRHSRCRCRAPAVGRRLLGRPFHSQNPSRRSRTSRAQVRLPGDARRTRRASDQRDRGPEPGSLLRAQAPLPPHQGRGAGGALHDADRQGAHPPRGRRPLGDHVGRHGLHGRRGRAAARLDGVSVEIVDLRTVMPWDKAAVLESAGRPRRCSSCTRTRAAAASAARSPRRSPRRRSRISTRR
jgi:hypothetical protein